MRLIGRNSVSLIPIVGIGGRIFSSMRSKSPATAQPKHLTLSLAVDLTPIYTSLGVTLAEPQAS